MTELPRFQLVQQGAGRWGVWDRHTGYWAVHDTETCWNMTRWEARQMLGFITGEGEIHMGGSNPSRVRAGNDRHPECVGAEVERLREESAFLKKWGDDMESQRDEARAEVERLREALHQIALYGAPMPNGDPLRKVGQIAVDALNQEQS